MIPDSNPAWAAVRRVFAKIGHEPATLDEYEAAVKEDLGVPEDDGLSPDLVAPSVNP